MAGRAVAVGVGSTAGPAMAVSGRGEAAAVSVGIGGPTAAATGAGGPAKITGVGDMAAVTAAIAATCVWVPAISTRISWSTKRGLKSRWFLPDEAHGGVIAAAAKRCRKVRQLPSAGLAPLSRQAAAWRVVLLQNCQGKRVAPIGNEGRQSHSRHDSAYVSARFARRMIEGMTCAPFRRKGAKAYIGWVKTFAAFLKRPPETARHKSACVAH